MMMSIVSPLGHALGFEGKTVYVYGLGKSGQAAINALLADGARVWAWDDREANLTSDFIGAGRVSHMDPDDIDWNDVDAVMKSPGIPPNRPAVLAAEAHNIPIISDMDLLYRRNPKANFIGITGTNGKSTTTALVAHVLRAAGKNAVAGGNLGQAVLSLPVLDSEGIYVLELSSYQLELVKELQLDASVILNLTPDHLERYGDMETYLAAKTIACKRTKAEAPIILGVDSPMLADYAKDLSGNVQTISLQGNEAEYRVTSDGKLMQHGRQIADLTYFDNLPGPHNWQNITVALLLCAPWLAADEFFKYLRTFNGLPHRMEKIQTLDGITFINDSKATNPESAIAALQSFKNIYWIAGGKAKAEGVTPCVDYLKDVRAAFVIGDAQDDFHTVLDPHVATIKCETLDNAVRQAYDAARQAGSADAVILLSPACASFDQFDSFEQRGDAFASLCRMLTRLDERSA